MQMWLKFCLFHRLNLIPPPYKSLGELICPVLIMSLRKYPFMYYRTLYDAFLKHQLVHWIVQACRSNRMTQ